MYIEQVNYNRNLQRESSENVPQTLFIGCNVY